LSRPRYFSYGWPSMTKRASVTYDTCSHDSTCASPPNLRTPPAQLVHQGGVDSITPGKHSSTPLPACTELAGEARCQHGSGDSSCSKMFPLLQRIAHALGGPSKLHARMKSAQYASGEPKMHHPCVHYYSSLVLLHAEPPVQQVNNAQDIPPVHNVCLCAPSASYVPPHAKALHH